MSGEDQGPKLGGLAAKCLEALRAGAAWEGLADRLALAAAEPVTATAASRELFAGVVEPLADSFDPEQAAAYAVFFKRVLGVVRRAPGFEEIDAALGQADGRVVEEPRKPFPWSDVRRVVVLSRVTLGADVAVTSVFLRMALDLPSKPEVVFAAGEKNLALFAGEARVRPMEIRYPRGGTLAERLAVWIEARRAIEAEAAELGEGELLVLDPDSRVTQLGLLTVAPANQRYAFFDSRSAREGEPGPLGAIAAEWLEERFGAPGETPMPWLALPPDDLERGRAVRCGWDAPVAAVNFGVGGNGAKRVGEPFETEAVKLLAERGFRLVIDAGAGEDERRRAERLVAELAAAGAPGVLHEGSFTSFAGVVAAADLFVGHDSGAAHAAAALGVRAIDVFAGAPSETMRSRWSPWGRRPALVLAVEEGEAPDNVLWRLRELLG